MLASLHSDASTTLDKIFALAALRQPERLALIDPPNRQRFTDGIPKRLTYGQADYAISTIAARLRQMQLPDHAVVAIQLPNVVEAVLTILGVMRAGYVAAPLPLLWRHADCVAALSRLGVKAIVTCCRLNAMEPCRVAMEVASRLFAIRYVCAFGQNLPNGVVALDDVFDAHSDKSISVAGRTDNDAGRVAVVTFDMQRDGPVPMPRTHLQVIAGGLAPLIESGAAENAMILSCIPLGSFAGLAIALVPWLLTRGTLVLHTPFDPPTLAAQFHEHDPDLVILPGPLVSRISQAGLLGAPAAVKAILSIWRAPERLQGAEPWQDSKTALVDLIAFGEIGLLAARRGADGHPVPLTVGPITVPRVAARATIVAEIRRTDAGTLGLRGPMVCQHPDPTFGRDDAMTTPDGLADTGFPCRLERDKQTIAITGPPPGMVGVGGYRFALRKLQELVSQVDRGGTIAALPDTLTGHRLAGHASDRCAMRKTLADLGANALIAAAFNERPVAAIKQA
ncbi:MAG: AMP-binding protein [Rhizobiales bacterium]|nr:AMP-binding protein [Hyphomicrobiales bacterium]